MKFVVGFFRALAVGILSIVFFAALTGFSTLYSLDRTLLKADFVVEQINTLDIPAVFDSYLKDQLNETVPNTSITLGSLLGTTVTELEPWLKEQAETAVRSSYDYMWSKTDAVNVSVSLAPVKESLTNNLIKAALAAPVPPQYQGLPQGTIRTYITQEATSYVNSTWQQADIPEKFTWNSNSLSTENRKQIQDVRRALSYHNPVYWGLIGLMVLLAGLIFLTLWNVKKAAMTLGIDLIIYGAVELIFILVFSQTNWLDMAGVNVLTGTLEQWVLGIISAFFAAARNLSIGVLVAGVLLLVVSIVYRPTAAKS